MTNPCQEPTPYQEAMQELRDNVAYLKEQLREAVRLLKAAHHVVYTKGNNIGDINLMIGMDCFFDQNADIVKELE